MILLLVAIEQYFAPKIQYRLKTNQRPEETPPLSRNNSCIALLTSTHSYIQFSKTISEEIIIYIPFELKNNLFFRCCPLSSSSLSGKLANSRLTDEIHSSIPPLIVEVPFHLLLMEFITFFLLYAIFHSRTPNSKIEN